MEKVPITIILVSLLIIASLVFIATAEIRAPDQISNEGKVKAYVSESPVNSAGTGNVILKVGGNEK